ncbi:MAG: response regulator [Planctomycetes bacterium]|nr:response regulator [Planctomycetota bacterium]MBL7041898.1 response regulator [Pirellulaceae bacterium]
MAKQVLLVDDDRTTVQFLSEVLREDGYDAVPAYDGKECMQQLEQAKPDLIVLDVMMPGKSGFVLFKELRRHEQYKDIPIIMLSGVGRVIEELNGHKGETSEKPFDPIREVLKKKIQELREEGLVRPEMFVDKPVDADAFIAKVRELIGS